MSRKPRKRSSRREGRESLDDYPGRWRTSAERRRLWARRFGLSEAQVAWLPQQPRFTRLLGRVAPGWRQESDDAGPYLGRTFELGGCGEALLFFNHLAALLPGLQTPSRYALTVDSGGDVGVRLSDREAEAVTVDEGWSACLLQHVARVRRRKRSPLRRAWRRLRRRLGFGPARLTEVRLREELATRRGWARVVLRDGTGALLQGYVFAGRNAALVLANGVAGVLGHLWDDVEHKTTVEETVALVTLSATPRAWPPRDLLDAADWIDELATGLGAEVTDLGPAVGGETDRSENAAG